MYEVTNVQSNVIGTMERPEYPPKIWLMTGLLGLIQVTKAKTLRPCQMKPGNQYQMKPPITTYKNHLYLVTVQPLV